VEQEAKQNGMKTFSAANWWMLMFIS